MGRKKKFTPEQTAEIRSSDKTIRALAEEYGVAVGTIFRVRSAINAYAPPYVGTPILNSQGEIVGIRDDEDVAVRESTG